jgi:hypothetical protein
MLLRNSAAAIACCFAVPSLWTVLMSIVPWLHGRLQPWAGFVGARLPFDSGGEATAADRAHPGPSAYIWVLLPLAAGCRMLLRSEVGSRDRSVP